MRAESSNQPLDKNLEHGGRDERVQNAHDSVVDVPEGAHSNLHAQDDEDGDEAGQQGGEPDGDDFAAHRVAVLGPDDLAVGEGDGEGSRGRRPSKVHLREVSDMIGSARMTEYERPGR